MTNELSAGRGTVDGIKDKLVVDLKAVAGDGDQLLKQAASSTAQGFAAAMASLEGKLGEAKTSLDATRLALSDKARHAADISHEYVAENPWKVFGVVALAGLVLGALFSRREHPGSPTR